jgi:hypothetical protein
VTPTVKIKEIEIKELPPMFSLRRLAEFFDCYEDSGKPSTQTILGWWHSGRIPPPDFRLSKKAVYWLPETILTFVDRCGLQ